MSAKKAGASPKTKTRLQFDFSPQLIEELEQLKQNLGAPSRSEAIRRAIKVYRTITDLEKDGVTLLTRQKDGTVKGLVFI